ncbi:MAG TPA: Crp/Fnr family transcriptional regulator [Casimicrobiaceae bacterium]
MNGHRRSGARKPDAPKHPAARPRSSPSSIQNWLLAKLSRADYERLMPHLEPIELSLGEIVYEADARQSYLYFPTTSVVSLVYTMKDGASAEMGVVGNEGVVGLALYMGGGRQPNRALVQVAGAALRMKAKALRAELYRHGSLQLLLLRYAQALLTQVSQTAVCNCLHSVEQRLCRWLLLCDDRVRPRELALTQAFIATMLGVRREAVTAAAQKLQAARWIRYSHGRIVVLDRRGLENRVCECYQVVRREAERLLGGTKSSTTGSTPL